MSLEAVVAVEDGQAFGIELLGGAEDGGGDVKGRGVGRTELVG